GQRRGNTSPMSLTPLCDEAPSRTPTSHLQASCSSAWTLRTQDAKGITLGTRLGSVEVAGFSGGNPDQAVASAVSALPSSKWQDVTLVMNLKGAHLGEQDGVGAVYAANLVGSSQAAAKVRLE